MLLTSYSLDLTKGLFRAEIKIRNVSNKMEDVGQLLLRVESDLEQAFLRPINSNNVNMALSGTATSIFFTKAGWPNAQDIQRSEYQRVEYTFANKTLTRSHPPILDAPASTAKLEKTFTDILNFHLSYLNDDSEWKDAWDSDSSKALPVAIKVTIGTNEAGEIYRIIELPSYAAQSDIE